MFIMTAFTAKLRYSFPRKLKFALELLIALILEPLYINIQTFCLITFYLGNRKHVVQLNVEKSKVIVARKVR